MFYADSLSYKHTRFLREKPLSVHENGIIGFLNSKSFSPLILYFIEYYIKNKLNKVNEINNGNTSLLLIKPFYTLYLDRMGTLQTKNIIPNIYYIGRNIQHFTLKLAYLVQLHQNP